jgi:3D-(3,5/4)-trihydroxycyclohexane-1,2-dione acylhydrolase (decyclizing)
MMSSEIVTSLQEHAKLIVVLVDNHGFASIGGLSESLGSGGFGTRYRYREGAGMDLDGDLLRVDFAANAASLGAHAIPARTIADLGAALSEAKGIDRTVVITIETDPKERVESFETWWNVPVAETSEQAPVEAARGRYEKGLSRERWLT